MDVELPILIGSDFRLDFVARVHLQQADGRVVEVLLGRCRDTVQCHAGFLGIASGVVLVHKPMRIREGSVRLLRAFAHLSSPKV